MYRWTSESLMMAVVDATAAPARTPRSRPGTRPVPSGPIPCTVVVKRENFALHFPKHSVEVGAGRPATACTLHFRPHTL